jgi:hypothetical protein
LTGAWFAHIISTDYLKGDYEMSTHMRKEFEAWLEEYSMFPFDSPRAAGYWQAWQASRAALVIELPAAMAYEQIDGACRVFLSYKRIPESMGDTVGLSRRDDVIKAIHAAGVKTK